MRSMRKVVGIADKPVWRIGEVLSENPAAKFSRLARFWEFGEKQLGKGEFQVSFFVLRNRAWDGVVGR